MKFGIGLKGFVIVVFLIIFFSSMIVLNNYYTKQQGYLVRAIDVLREVVAKPDSLMISTIIPDISETWSGIRAVQSETRLYSAVITFLTFAVSCLIFIFFVVKLTKPLYDIQKATKNLKAGDFNVYIRPSGIKEVRELAKSFNEMSKELENTQQKLLISQKQMIWKDLARILTHEIKNPLTPIQLTIQRMEEKFYTDKVKFDEIFPESLQLVFQEINNLQNLVTSFSSYAKDINTKPTIFDPAIAIRDIIKPYMDKYDIVLNLKENCRIRFDNTHFYQVVTNIFQNAIESSEKNSKFFISIEKSHSFLVIKIRDQGAGMSPEDLTRIFEPYFTKKSKGTGLGLALVKKLCDANQCLVHVKSSLGEGSIFELILEDDIENS